MHLPPAPPAPRLVALALATVLALLGPTAAALASGQDVIRDCTDDEIMSRTYAQKEYRAALRELAADADQYGNCRDVIRRAQQAALAAGRNAADDDAAAGGGSGRSGGAGAIGSAPTADQLSSASKAERRGLERARATPGRVSLDSVTVDPAKVGTVPGVSQVADLPAPLVGLLALLLAGTLALGGLRLQRLVHARRA